jgi:hypothetical protein
MNCNKIKQIFQAMVKSIVESGEFRPTFQALPGDNIFDKELLPRGEMLLWGEAARGYVKAREDVIGIATAEKTWSPTSVDETLSHYLGGVLHAIPERRAEALQSGASEILKRFNDTPKPWTVDLFVNGVDTGCAGLAFGRFSFVIAAIETPQYVAKNMSLDQATSLVMARTEVFAIDEQSAVQRARSSLEEHLGALNALCSVEVPPSSIRLSHSSHIAQTYSICHANAVGQEPGEMWFQPVQNRFPLTRQAFLDAMETRGGYQVSRILSDPSSEFSDRVLSAYVLAGGACVDLWPERSFFLFAIALESVALGRGIKSEITYQLGTRVAHLIGKNLEGRRDVATQISRLYNRRSQIVHEGKTGVANDEMYLIYLYCMAALHTLVLSPAFSHMRSNADLDEWFRDRVLEAPDYVHDERS